MGDVEHVTEEDRARFHVYALLARALAAPPDQAFLDILKSLEGDATELGRAFVALSRAAGDTTEADAADEYSKLFYGQGQGGEVLPYASYYITGSLNDKPLMNLRADMERFGISHGKVNGEPEDHIAYILEMMHGLISGAFSAGAVGLDEQTAFYAQHLAPWAPDFLNDLKEADSARFYLAVADAGMAFLAIEGDAFRMAA